MIWHRVHQRIQFWRSDFRDDPVPATAAAIRLWLNDPANAEQLAKVTSLDLTLLGLRVLPPEIGKFTSLELLCLIGNKLVNLPPEIGDLTLLKDLNLSHNQLANLPPEIGKCTSLERLNLYFNQLANLPPEIDKCTSLLKPRMESNRKRPLK